MARWSRTHRDGSEARLTGVARGKARAMRTVYAFYWLVIVAGLLSAILAAALDA